MFNKSEVNSLPKVFFPVFFITLFTLISSAGLLSAAVMPAYERLQPIEDNVNAPTSVAISKYEYIFVAESVNDKVLIYSQSGQYMDEINGLNRPISVAVDNNTRIFIGNKDSGNVEVYDSSYNYLFKLGRGDGEFTQPNDIAIAGTGDIYVVDKLEGVVKIYNPDGSYKASFGSPGNGNGQFHNPTSITIDRTAGELIVLDHQLTQDMFGNWIEGARIQVFDMNGGFKRSFSKYGNNIGDMFRPQHVTVDSQGRLYVTDSFHNVVLVYDTYGTYLGDVYDIDNPVRTPMGIAIGGSNRLYIASLSTGRVEVYGIEPYVQMVVSPLSLTFQGQIGGNSPATQSIDISNNGTGTLSWTATTNNSWITLSTTAGSTQPSGISSLDVGVDLNGLTAGTYTGSINIRAASGAMETVSVGLTVVPTAELSVNPTDLTFTSTNGSNPSSQDITITNTGGGTLNWSATTDQNWILIDKTSGSAPDTVSVSVDIISMNTGTHTGTIEVTAQGAVSSPAVIQVTLEIVEMTGTINVTTNLAGATFTISGPQSYSSSGTGWTVTDAPTGTYTIVYGDVQGFITPSSQSQTLQSGGTINFHGEYIIQGGGQQTSQNKNIIVGSGPGKNNKGTVKIFKSDGTYAGVEFLAHGYNYGVNIAAGDIDGDGVDEIITAPGPGPNNPAEVKIFDKNGNHLTNLNITAYQYKYGANVAAGDFNGDGNYEVVVGTGAGEANPAEVKVYVYDSTGQEMVDSGIDLTAYGSGPGVRVAAGDVDGDGVDEIITVPGPGKNNQGTVRVWEVDTSLGTGQWTAGLAKEFTTKFRYRYSVSIACGDADGDGNAEIIAGAGPHRRARARIKVYDSDGGIISEFRAHIRNRYGVNVAVGDLDDDGTEEIVAGTGPGIMNRAIVKVFDINGVEQTRFKAMRSRYGVNVAVGDLGL